LIMRLFAIAIALCSFWGLTDVSRAQESAGSPVPLQVRLRKEEAEFVVPRYTAFVTMDGMGSDKFAFLVPESFLIRGDPKSGILTLANPQGSWSITCSILDTRWTDSSTLNADDYRESVLKDYPSATILQEFSRNFFGGSGPVFDLQWKTSSGFIQCKRVMFLSSPFGMLKLTATASRKDFDTVNSILSSMLASFRYSNNGVLKVPPLPTGS
jgi:hypothetical protein